MFSNMDYIYEVYRQRSFSKAAERLFISQPSLSLTIKKAEKKIGAQIFDRSTSPIQLTECGMEYIKCIERMMDIKNGFESYLNDLNELKTGSLAVGASNFFASYILPPVITMFKTKYPLVSINLIEADTANLEKLLFSGELDLIVDNYNFNDSIYQKHLFYSENLLLMVPAKLIDEKIKEFRLKTEDVARNKHLKPEILPVPAALLGELPFLLLRHGNDTRVRADKLFSFHRIKPNIILELDQLATAFHIAYRGLGATFVSDTLVKEIMPDDRVSFFKLDFDYARRNNYFYYRHNKYVSRSMEEFLSIACS